MPRSGHARILRHASRLSRAYRRELARVMAESQTLDMDCPVELLKDLVNSIEIAEHLAEVARGRIQT